MDERDKRTELLVGLFLSIGLLLLGLLILEFSSVSELFKGTYALRVALPDGTGVKDGTPVELGGRKIGKASDKPSFNPTFTGVIIPLEIYRQVKIPADARFSLGTSGLLGDTFIEIKPSGKPAAGYIEPGSLIQGEPSKGLGALQSQAQEVGEKVKVVLEDVRAAVKDLRDALQKINEGVLSEESARELKETFRHFNSVITRLDEKTFSEQTSAEIREAVSSFKATAKTMERGAEKLDPAFGRIDSAAAKIDQASSKAETVLDSADAAMKSIDRNAAAVGDSLRALTRGDGLLQALMKDSQLRTEFQRLITNLREHGVLFYRDDSAKREARQQQGKQEPPPRRGSRPMTGTK